MSKIRFEMIKSVQSRSMSYSCKQLTEALNEVGADVQPTEARMIVFVEETVLDATEAIARRKEIEQALTKVGSRNHGHHIPYLFSYKE